MSWATYSHNSCPETPKTGIAVSPGLLYQVAMRGKKGKQLPTLDIKSRSTALSEIVSEAKLTSTSKLQAS